MLLTITYTGQNTQNLGFLLYKNPARPQTVTLSYGKAYIFYPEISDTRTTAALLLSLDPIDLARGKAGSTGGGLFDYVNDRPYVSSSFMSTAISKAFGTAMSGRADEHQALSDSTLDLTAVISMLPCVGEKEKLSAVFAPLGYEVQYDAALSDEKFPAWGESRYVNLTLHGKVRLRDLLRHIFVLIPVFDRQKHYWVGEDEVKKLLSHGEGWLENHPEKAYITGRYLGRRKSLVSMAFAQLAGHEDAEEPAKESSETRVTLNMQRLNRVLAALKSSGASSVVDLGCGEGRLLSLLIKERQFSRIAGMDVSHVALKRASDRLRLESAGESYRERIALFQGSLTYKDSRISGFEAASVVEVVEHLDPARLSAFERVLFAFAKPKTIVLTTPNKEYNANYAFLHPKDLRHGDHRFEWTRAEFRNWANRIAADYGYRVEISEIGEADEIHGAPTQMGVFQLCD
ncbi:MAG: 3' terminal RNA ribose 2'-O-methyltransferase Hen1 [Oscillospiraceae bacterium]|jgi:3' terminal RNA ribose 2'-O-methyltransferase Hen1|nr:3' terminal RNA ribose 2'-O-methyltransferase Hen1 [Oscillospiraceae bacterium]